MDAGTQLFEKIYSVEWTNERKIVWIKNMRISMVGKYSELDL